MPSCGQEANRDDKGDGPVCQIVELDESAMAQTEEDDGPFKAATERETKQAVERMLSGLTPRERHIVCLRFGIGNGGKDHTIEEIGKSVGLPLERVRQILSKALTKLRRKQVVEKD
jgi:RNA polymerase sigma factor (sigma-70 family)